MIGVFLAMLGCGPAPVIPWTEEGAILPTLEILDLDKSGGIEPGEWMRVSYGAAPFNELDSNGSGALDGIELLAWVRGADPDGFDGKRVTLRPNDGKPAGPGPVAREIREVGDAILFLIEEIQGTPDHLLPPKEAVRDASWSMTLRSPESRAVLQKLRFAWEVAGREFPMGPDWDEISPEASAGRSP